MILKLEVSRLISKLPKGNNPSAPVLLLTSWQLRYLANVSRITSVFSKVHLLDMLTTLSL